MNCEAHARQRGRRNWDKGLHSRRQVNCMAIAVCGWFKKTAWIGWVVARLPEEWIRWKSGACVKIQTRPGKQKTDRRETGSSTTLWCVHIGHACEDDNQINYLYRTFVCSLNLKLWPLWHFALRWRPQSERKGLELNIAWQSFKTINQLSMQCRC